MKASFDYTKSKRPIFEPDEKDLARAHSDIAAIGEDILMLEEIGNILNNDENYLKVLAISHGRIRQIMERSLDIPLNKDTLLEHSEIKGQLKERIRLTKELEGIKIASENKKSLKEKIKTLISSWEKKLKGTGNG